MKNQSDIIECRGTLVHHPDLLIQPHRLPQAAQCERIISKSPECKPLDEEALCGDGDSVRAIRFPNRFITHGRTQRRIFIKQFSCLSQQGLNLFFARLIRSISHALFSVF
ncbi:MAG: hypothetical protein IAF08_11310 [Rhizobacter sp.]|nr:hypothetical protein [Chlorobiales bacterium]